MRHPNSGWEHAARACSPGGQAGEPQERRRQWRQKRRPAGNSRCLPGSCASLFNPGPTSSRFLLSECRRQLRAAALLGAELDLPAAAAGLAGLQEALSLHLHSAAAAAPVAPHAHAHLAEEQLAQLLTLADAAAQRFADLADAAAAAAADGAAAAGDAAAKKDNGWLQPLVTALETVLTFIEVGAGLQPRAGRSGEGAAELCCVAKPAGRRRSVWLEQRLLLAAAGPRAAVSPRSPPVRDGQVPSVPPTEAVHAIFCSPTHPPTHFSVLQDGLKRLNVPYSYGWSIVALTALIKVATFPLTKKQARRRGRAGFSQRCLAVQAERVAAGKAGGRRGRRSRAAGRGVGGERSSAAPLVKQRAGHRQGSRPGAALSAGRRQRCAVVCHCGILLQAGPPPCDPPPAGQLARPSNPKP